MKEKETYKRLQKKYKLPSLKDLMREFGIKVEDHELLLHHLVERMKDFLFDKAKTLESIIFVRSSSEPSQLYETKMLENKERVFELYKDLQSLGWKGERIKTLASEEEMASYIKEVFDAWTKNLKEKFLNVCKTFEEKWKDAKLRESSELMYHG